MESSEISELISSVREHVLYMQELGIELLDVEIKTTPVGNAEGTISEQGPAQAAIPSEDGGLMLKEPSRELPDMPMGISPPTGAKPARKQSKLTALPSLSKRTPANGISESSRSQARENKTLDVNLTEQIGDKPMESAPEKKAGSLSDALFDAGPELPGSGETIEDIRRDIGECTRCELYTGRTQVVHSTGNFQADLMFVGEAPGADEDAQGFPFVGRAGQLLTKIIEGIGYKREEVFIGNINRCRPPANRTPTLPEAHTCRPFLLREIAVVRPKVIIVMGNTALHNLLDTKDGITKVRGRFQDYFGVKVMPTFHPAYLLRDPHKKREVWEDMKKVRDYLKTAK